MTSAATEPHILTKVSLAAAYRRGPYAWPGGYPQFLWLHPDEFLCWPCFRQEYNPIWTALVSDDQESDWYPLSIEANWEDDALYCSHCNAHLESAYGAPEED